MGLPSSCVQDLKPLHRGNLTLPWHIKDQKFFNSRSANFQSTEVPSAPVMRSTASFRLNRQPGCHQQEQCILVLNAEGLVAIPPAGPPQGCLHLRPCGSARQSRRNSPGVLPESPDLIGPDKSGVIVKTREGGVSNFLHQGRGWNLDRTGVGVQQLTHDFQAAEVLRSSLSTKSSSCQVPLPRAPPFQGRQGPKILQRWPDAERRNSRAVRKASINRGRQLSPSIWGLNATHPQQQGDFGDSPGHFSPINTVLDELGKILLPPAPPNFFACRGTGGALGLRICTLRPGSQALLVLVTEVPR